ncbi:MAG: hypothetical protein OXH65_12875 [Paracoccaceae bacterium]|nr:hypothetical protein [Paracoccaceae bacterium]MDE2675989.1 hypothetical protein [Paracoccaceae bacterium]
MKTTGSLVKQMVLYLPKEIVDFASKMENVLEVYQRSCDDKTTLVCLEETFG